MNHTNANAALRVLIIDDTPTDVTLLLRFLKKLPQEIEHKWASTLSELRELLAHDKAWDLVLCDYVMPGMTPFDVQSELRAAGLDPAFMLMSGSIDEGALIDALALGVDEYILKQNMPKITQLVPKTLRASKQRADKRLAEQRLIESETRNRAILSAIPDLILGLSPEGIIRNFSSGESGWFHKLLEASYGKPIDEVLPAFLVQPILGTARAAMTSEGVVRAELKAEVDGEKHFFECRALAHVAPSQTERELLVMLRDITELRRAEEERFRRALFDPLTGLPNKSQLLEQIDEFLSLDAEPPAFVVMFIQINQLQSVFATLGYDMGDQFLMSFVQRLTKVLGEEERLFCVEGRSFGIFLSGDDVERRATSICGRIQIALEAPFLLGVYELYAHVSIGLVLGHARYLAPFEVMRDAEIASSKAMTSGRTHHAMFEPDMRLRSLERLSLETALRRAIQYEEFVLYYQPIVCLKTGQIDGFEALIRWQHPDQGLLSPGAFIQIVEESSMVFPVGEWVLKEGCRQLGEWQKSLPAPIRVSLNLASRQFTQPQLASQLRKLMREHEIEPARLKLELTEGVLLEESDTVQLVLKLLQEAGLTLVLDDFGTGYSSLSYLHRFAMHQLKIDRSFIMEIKRSGEEFEIVRAMVAMAHALGMKVTAEGIEDEAQLAIVRELGCSYAQGYLFSRPVPAVEAEAMIRERLSW